MKIAVRRTYFGDRLCFPGIVPHALLDLRAAHTRRLVLEGVCRADAVAQAERAIASDLPALLRDDPELTEVRRLHEWAAERAGSGDLHDGCTWLHVPKLLGPPVGSPRMVWGMSGNYPRQRPNTADPSRPDRPEPDGPPAPRGFVKAPGSLAGAYDDIRYPAISSHVEPEIELAAVISRRCRGLKREDAMSAVAGYVAFCDLSARDIGAQDRHLLDRAKGFDTFGIVGPWFVTADEIPDPHKLRVRCWVNGEERQDGNTSGMLHDIPEQLAWLSSALTLRPGDVLSTGTPAAVAPIVPGDVLRGEVEGLGVMENAVLRQSATAARSIEGGGGTSW
ncbi:fumarylacetoacetate hydrolase family protein [Actinospica sp.]|jgi:5-oxopent-3-ene-1,2,5-tricarboxylate decarboxylase/2-hydroxyhepta-2,4-diene-1,7-dioate isomerase|uniref:fumarylacetoacetate hydrolase family protein n=1 Tax=Actinospica sp. TaxID=1872142 RepID=UPI002C2C9B9C|nr:fumarylacetoacetate hydrolase family protein [Actinospica sp.]HWG24665.1 fumarylacetoacetate hydrolase family protein [Actinospica sp.]